MTPQAILPRLVLGVAIAGVEAELPKRLTEINALKDKPIILVCCTDKRSANAAALLRDSGFRDVHGLRGGMEQWNGNGLPVAPDRPRTDVKAGWMSAAPLGGTASLPVSAPR